MTTPFSTRLALAQRMIAHGPRPLPGHVADQLGAASSDTRQLHDRIGVVMPLLQPDRHWRQRVDAAPASGAWAYLLAALLGCTTICPHLRKGGPQPAIVRLPLRLIACGRCSLIIRRPPADEADRCDVCGARGIEVFHPFAVRLGPLLIAGDACSGCADELGIVGEAAS